MKNATALLLLFILNFSFAQNTQKEYFIDENGKSMELEPFLEKWRATDCEYARWNYSNKDSSKVSRLTHKKFETYKVDAKLFRDFFSSLSDKKYNDSTTFLIEYKFLNDKCEKITSSNNWNYEKMVHRLKFTNNQKNIVKNEDKNIIYLVILEKGIKFFKSKIENEYYFSDRDNFLRKNLFLHPTLCGSFLITKADGFTLVRNGEFRADLMLEYLEDSVWKSIFEN